MDADQLRGEARLQGILVVGRLGVASDLQAPHPPGPAPDDVVNDEGDEVVDRQVAELAAGSEVVPADVDRAQVEAVAIPWVPQ